MPDLAVSVVPQPLVWGVIAKNFDHFTQVLTTLPSSDLIILPEMFPTRFAMQADH